YPSGGEEEGLKIKAAAEKAKSSILGEAYKLSQQVRGEGEGRAAKIYAASLTQGPAVYQFVRSLDAMKRPIDTETTVGLPVACELFQLVGDSRCGFPEY